jgi:hypothetical protein
MPKKPGIAFYGVVFAIAVAIVYPISFGPACWAASRFESLSPAVELLYVRYIRLSNEFEDSVLKETACRYARFGEMNGSNYFTKISVKRFMDDLESGRIQPTGSCFGDDQRR